MLLLFICIVSCQLSHVMSHPDGAPIKACDSLVPEFLNASPQTSSSPYRIIITETSSGINIRLKTEHGRSFKGFILQARDPSEESQGHFSIDIPGNSMTRSEHKHLGCKDGVDGTVTHTNPDDKTELKLKWEPNGYYGNIQFLGTFVENSTTYWPVMRTRTIEITKPNACDTKAACKTLGDKIGAKSRCQGKSDPCDVIQKDGKKYCLDSKYCTCCITGCGNPKPACENLGGVCQLKTAKCEGSLKTTSKLCHYSQTCGCCTPIDCSKETLQSCKVLNGTCIPKEESCDGREVTDKTFCNSPDTCKCCFPETPCDCSKKTLQSCKVLNGKCIRKEEACAGREVTEKTFCKSSDTCKCCFPDTRCDQTTPAPPTSPALTSTARHTTSITTEEDWPLGNYGLPMPTSGCPGTRSWTTGYRFHDTENGGPRNAWSNGIHLYGDKQVNDMFQHFCMKTDSKTGLGSWPSGQYCIFKYISCPSGFEEGYIYWDDENDSNANNISGIVPSGVYDSNTKIEFCCKIDGSYTSTIKLPTEKPFILFRYGDECQRVHGMSYSQEYFSWDTEDTNPSSYTSGYHPGDGTVSRVYLHYCYYYQ